MRTIAVVLALLAVGCGSPDSQEVEDFDGSGGAADGNESGGASSGGSEADGSGGDSELPSGGSSTGGSDATGGEDSGSGGDDAEATGGADQGSGGNEASGGAASMCDDNVCDNTPLQDGTHYCGGDSASPECLACTPGWCNCSQSLTWEPGSSNGEACETPQVPNGEHCSSVCWALSQ